MHRQASNKTIMGRGGHPPRPQQLMALLAVGRAPGMGPVAPTGPSQGSGIGVVPHELHVGVHHLPHQLLQGGREADDGPSAGEEWAARQERPGAQRAPPAPRSRIRRGRGFAGLFPQRPWPWHVCQCAAVHWGCPSLLWWLLSSKQEPGQGHQKRDFSVCPSHPTQRSPPPFPSPWIAFRGHEHPAGTKHARKATHIKCDSRLPVQLLSGFGTVPLQKILRKRRERRCEKRPPSPPQWPPRCSRFPVSQARPGPPSESSEDKIFLFKTQF